MMFYPADGEKPPYHAEPEAGQVAPGLPEGMSNEPEADDAAEAEAVDATEDDKKDGE
jgi:hypothetical protein